MDLAPYAGHWVALVDGQVAGVGYTAQEAVYLAGRNRPKDRVTVQFVEPTGGEPLPTIPLLEQLRPFFLQQPQPVYLVGGAVRDMLMGRLVGNGLRDLDFVVPQEAIKLAFAVANWLALPAYVLDKERDTGRVVLAEAETTLDFARFRGVDLTADLQDRDFTLNAMALPATAVTTASLIDPCHGLDDLRQGIIRATHPQAVGNDPVRALRGVRLALSLGLALEEETKALLRQAAIQLPQVSVERVRDELLKLLQTAVPDQAIGQLAELGLLTVVLPSLAELADVAQSPPHHEAVLPHTVSVLRWLVAVEEAVVGGRETALIPLIQLQTALASRQADLQAHLAGEVDGGINGRLLLRLGALFHDVGKADTQTIAENGRIRFLGHDKVGAKIAARQLRQLCLSNKAIDHVQAIVAGHMHPLSLANAQGGFPTRRAIYRYFRQSQRAGVDIVLLALADHLATYEGAGPTEQWLHLVELVTHLLQHYFQNYHQTIAPSPLLGGQELITALHLTPGPEVGRLLRLLEEAQAAGDIHTPAEALALAHHLRQ